MRRSPVQSRCQSGRECRADVLQPALRVADFVASLRYVPESTVPAPPRSEMRQRPQVGQLQYQYFGLAGGALISDFVRSASVLNN